MSERRRLTDRTVMWRALYDAYQWSESLSEAYSHDPAEQVVQSEKRYRASLERVAMRYFGKPIKATMDEPLKNMKLVSLDELRAPRIAEKVADHD